MTENSTYISLFSHPEFDAQLGGLIGLLIGDSIGVPFEFVPPELLPPRQLIDIQPPAGFARSHSGAPPGTWSDDGSQTLCLLASLLETNQFSITDFASKLLRWMDHGYMAIDSHVFDVGIQTADSLERIRNGVSVNESGGRNEWDNGNGSLMRCLPLALLHNGSDTDLVINAHAQSLPTHAHPRSMVCCALYCLVAAEYLQQSSDSWGYADTKLEAVYRSMHNDAGDRFLIELEVVRKLGRTETPCGTGYVVDCLWSAKKAMEETSFAEVVRSAVMFGNDTDTTSAVAGGLAGIRFGLSGIPILWLSRLRGFEMIQMSIADLIGHLKCSNPDSNRSCMSEFIALSN